MMQTSASARGLTAASWARARTGPSSAPPSRSRRRVAAIRRAAVAARDRCRGRPPTALCSQFGSERRYRAEQGKRDCRHVARRVASRLEAALSRLHCVVVPVEGCPPVVGYPGSNNLLVHPFLEAPQLTLCGPKHRKQPKADSSSRFSNRISRSSTRPTIPGPSAPRSRRGSRPTAAPPSSCPRPIALDDPTVTPRDGAGPRYSRKGRNAALSPFSGPHDAGEVPVGGSA